MDETTHSPMAAQLSRQLREARQELTARWLERISDRVAMHPNRIFPTDQLLDHIPLLIDGIADYLADPAQTISADTPVVAKAMDLGALRHAQGFDEYEILKEFEIFGGVLFAFITRAAEESGADGTASESFVCAHRLFHAVSLILQSTTTQFLQLAKLRVREREDRLRAFNRRLTHELRNRLGATIGAGQALDLPDLAESDRQRLTGVLVRNVASIGQVLDDLVELSRIDSDARSERRTLLRDVVAEVARQLREHARAKSVEVRVASDLPDLEVTAAALELCLTNLVSNAIKYADRSKPEQWVEVRARVEADGPHRPCELRIEVADNGAGVPNRERDRLFSRFFRSDDARNSGIPGTGLGLSIVRETVESLNGRVWAEHRSDGTTFAFAIPCRREGETTIADFEAASGIDARSGPADGAVHPAV